MKKFIFTIFVLLPFLVSSQSSSLKIKLGAGVPLGNYGSGNLDEAAFAKPGFAFDLSIERKFIDYLGIKASVLYNRNAINDLDIYSAARAINRKVHSVETGTYEITSLLLGLVTTFSVKSLISFDFYGLIGYSEIIDPGSKIEISNFQFGSFVNTTVISNRASTGSFCYNLGLDINFRISKGVSIIMGGSYHGAKAKYEDVSFTIIDNNKTTTGTTDYENTVSILNTNLGIKILIWELIK